jgi:phosphoglycolate phosphatase
MKISEFAAYKKIVILCHNIPDADTIGSAFALQQFLQSLGAEAVLIYGGWEPIAKPSLHMLLEALGIELTYTQELPPETKLLVTVDCQYGAGNVQRFDLPAAVALRVIDHHRAEIPEGEHTLIRPQLASCATLMWDLLRAEGYDMEHNYRVTNALYYGLYTDTNGLSELRHPLDRDLSELAYDAGLIRRLKNSAITLEELDVVSETLKNRESIQNIGLFRAVPCDPNLLGFSSDIAQQTAGIDCCVTYCEQRHGLKLSIRSSAREIMANEIAAFLCQGVGSGGGSIEKAGGFMSTHEIAQVTAGTAPDEYLRQRIRAYLVNYEHIYANNNTVAFGEMALYRKLPQRVGYVRSADIFPERTQITVRTLEGDIDTFAGVDIYLMIGIRGEAYPISRETFDRSYIALEEPYSEEAEYTPVILNRVTGEKRQILPYAQACVPHGEKLIRATPLLKDTKVFSHWDPEKYFCGVKGDYLAANEGNYEDCYIINCDIFTETYAPA